MEEIRAITVEVKPPHARSHLPSVTHNVVLVEEVGGPGDETDVSWLLLTTLPITTLDDVLRVIDFYVACWTVEIYFRTLKTGCRIEEIQLETNHRLKNYLAFYKIIAWRCSSKFGRKPDRCRSGYCPPESRTSLRSSNDGLDSQNHDGRRGWLYC